METFLLYIPFAVATFMGYLLVELLFAGQSRPPFMLRLLLGAAAGLGLCAALTFTSFIFFDHFKRAYLVAASAVLTAALAGGHVYAFMRFKDAFWKTGKFDPTQFAFFAALAVLSVPFWYLVHFYAYGGWDAWAAWNLKAKFLFLGGTQWEGMFDDKLWRSSPHYPLLLPLMNVWGWLFQKEPVFQGPCFTAFYTTMVLVGTLVYGLWVITKTRFAILAAPMLLLMGFYVKLSLSQYADNIVGLYLLAGVVCLVLARLNNQAAYAALAGFFLGTMSFAKNEGLLAALSILVLAVPYIYWKNPAEKRHRLVIGLCAGAAIGFIPFIVFSMLYAPESLTFVNGFTSQAQPVTGLRVKTILGYYTMEVGSPIWRIFAPFIEGLEKADFADKWNGIWIVLGVSLLMGVKHCLARRQIIIPVFLILYMSAVTFYYIMNTYFPIEWWLQVTLHRIISALLPTVIFWAFLSLWPEDKKI